MKRTILAASAVLLMAAPVRAQGAAQASDTVRHAMVEGHLLQPRQLPYDRTTVAALRAPAGFRVTAFADHLAGSPRMLAVGADGTVYVTRRDSGDVVALRDRDGDGVAEERRTVVASLPQVHGIHVANGRMFLATVKEIYVADVTADGGVSVPRLVVGDLPDGGQHPNRTLAIGPDGMLYVSIGSTCNNCAETNPEHATLLRMNVDGSGRGVYARGLRNTIGWGWHPVTGSLWGMDHGSDWRGDDTPPEELNRIENGTDYGWPYCYGDRREDRWATAVPPDGDRAGFCRRTAAPVLTFTAHGAPIGMAFYTGSQFPAEYRNDAFVAMRGSWNRLPPSGYSIVRVRYDAQGNPTRMEDFVTGFLTPDGQASRGRVAGVAVAADGSLLFTDDTNGVVYRVAYTGSPR